MGLQEDKLKNGPDKLWGGHWTRSVRETWGDVKRIELEISCIRDPAKALVIRKEKVRTSKKNRNRTDNGVVTQRKRRNGGKREGGKI